MRADEPNLVLATAWNLGINDVYIFVESLRRYYRGDAMVLVSSQGSATLVKYLRSRDITPVYFDCARWMVMNVQLSRYVRYGEILRDSSKQYARVLLSDASDVVFQADPFAGIPDDELVCFLEVPGRTIGSNAMNTMWVQQIFGASVFERIKDFEISCSGITIGSHHAIVRYIDLLLGHAKPDLLSTLINFRGHDQGIHNYLLRTGALPEARLVPNGEHVYTLALTKMAEMAQVRLEPHGIILARGSRLCPIVHQYTYKPHLLAHVRSAYPLSGEKLTSPGP